MKKEQISYNLSGGLEIDQLRVMHTQALDIIEKVGIEVPHKQVCKLLADSNGVRIEGNRVFLTPELVEKCTKGISYPQGESFEVLSGAYSMNILDMDTNKIRVPVYKDLIEMIKLTDAMDMSVIAPVTPSDVPVPLQSPVMFKAAWENSSRGIGGGVLTTVEQAEYVYQMSQVVNKPFALALWVISPLKMDSNCLDIIFHFLDRNIEMWVATMPMTGSTSPIFFIGSYVQSIAETLAAATILKLISRGGKVSYGFKDSFRAYPFDMRYGSIAYGSAEYVLMTLIQMKISDYFDLPRVVKSLITTSKQPDAHAAAEKMGHTMAAASAGAQSYSNAGMLSVDEVYSPVQCVIDNEILNYVKRVLKGYEFSTEVMSADIIREVVQSGESFLQHGSTIENYKEMMWLPELFEHQMLDQWNDRGQKGVIDRAAAIAREKILQADFQLPDDIQKDLDKIYKHAEKHLLLMNTGSF